MAQFVVIPRDAPGQFDDFSPEDMQQLIGRYHAWGQDLAEKGRMVLGHKLVDGAGKVIRDGAGAMSVTDGPFAEANEVVGGLWIINADNLEDAVQAVSECPHIKYGSLEVREIEVMDEG